MNFAIDLIFPIKPFFLHDQNAYDKNLNILRTARAFKMKKKHFSRFLKGFQWNK